MRGRIALLEHFVQNPSEAVFSPSAHADLWNGTRCPQRVGYAAWSPNFAPSATRQPPSRRNGPTTTTIAARSWDMLSAPVAARR